MVCHGKVVWHVVWLDMADALCPAEKDVQQEHGMGQAKDRPDKLLAKLAMMAYASFAPSRCIPPRRTIQVFK